ncbi:serine hydrolase domain-containing protein [Chitinophaga silvatica]|nr:serine hydrolase [Chitinophaga silvatica]
MKKVISMLMLAATVTAGAQAQQLLRSTPAAEKVSEDGIEAYKKAVEESGQQLHSFMIVRHGKVVAEQYYGDNAADKPHVMFSVSKTFTATAIGFAVQEKLLKLDDKVIKFFPDDLPAEVSPNLAALEIRHLLTMSVGQEVEPNVNAGGTQRWERVFLETPITHAPGTRFLYNSIASYMLSSIIQKVTGKTIFDYLTPRLFKPLQIDGARWESNAQGVNFGGWGLFIKTEDMAKMGQFIMQKGRWKNKQLISKEWIADATSSHIKQPPQWMKPDADQTQSDWAQGYGYQMWRCRFGAVRADGKDGQFIIIIPDKDAVVTTTANIQNMQEEINLIWKHILPALN